MRVIQSAPAPFKFVEYKPNEHIKVTRNPDYWKKTGPISRDRIHDHQDPSTANLAFIAGKSTSPFIERAAIPQMKNIESRCRRRSAS